MVSGRLKQSGLRQYFKAFVLFLLYMVFSILYFFYCVQVNVVAAAEQTIVGHVERQGYHFQEIMNIQFEFLEGMARYIGGGEELLSYENLEIIRSVCHESGFERMAIIDGEGISTYENGVQKEVKGRTYFQEAMAGRRALSDPLKSKVDGDERVIMAVPIFCEGRVAGVLGGSCDVGSLSHLLFEDIYDGAGYTVIVASDGTVVSCDRDQQHGGCSILKSDNFFHNYQTMEFVNNSSMEQMKEDFNRRLGGYAELRDSTGAYYLVYRPLELNNWVLCYVVPGAKVRESYGFIHYYEVILSMVLLLGVAVLLTYIWHVNNKEHRELMKFAQTDALTGAMNKASTEAKINQWLTGGESQGIQVFLMLDIDNFKTVNDIYGHAVGDQALEEIGKVLAQEFRDNDIIGKIGGDEFVVLMKNIGNTEIAIARMETLCQRIREIFIEALDGNHLSCSVGAAFGPEHGTSYEELYLNADKALYVTKERGRDGFTVYKG